MLTAGNMDYLRKYLSLAPIPLGLIRAVDCRHLSTVEFRVPILDVGCGDGIFAEILFNGEKGKVDTGIDFDSAEIKKASRTGMYRELVRCSVTDMPFEDGSYQTVFSNSVLEHIPDLAPCLSEITRVLMPGGRFIFTVPSQYLSEQMLFPAIFKKIGLKSIARRYVNFKNRVWKHYHLYPPGVWRQKLEAHGFRVIKTEYIHPETITRLCDFFTFSGVFSIALRKLFGRLLLFPGRLRGAILAGFLTGLYHANAPTGSTIFMIAEKR